ncbi:hypothetical protein GCM10010305_14200 [Streptomyces termitum]|uniref:Integral membrane protein n=2 Tax=Streptomyces termitum TaxID=67368 RepID=A0A918SWW6_9ACTN|nr:hypothetical protein GCM10010305_14200 [Streptomyces termitum]
MRGPAAPTSPGAWDARSEALLAAPAAEAETGIAAGPGPLPTLDLHADPRPEPADPDATALDALLAAFGPPRLPALPEAAATAAPESVVSEEAPESVVPEEASGTAASESAARETVASEAAAPEAVASEAAVSEDAPAGPPDGESAGAPAGPDLRDAPGGPVAPGPGAAWGEAPGGRPRRGGGDPVKVLMRRHRELCERAVDPLEIAAGLEALGFTDRTAARYRHRDVFTLAEELYARVPRGRREAAPAETAAEPRGRWPLTVLAPGAVAALAVPAVARLDGAAGIAAAAAGALALAAALALAVRTGPLRAPAAPPAARLWTLWLLGYAVAGDGLLDQVLRGGPDAGWPVEPAPLLGLALAVAPAAWCAHLFATRVRRRIATSRGLADFAAGARGWLSAAVLLHLAALAGLLAATGFSPGALALGALLLLARLLTVHGHPETAAAALAAACAAEALGIASVLAARLPLPGFDALAVPVRAAADTWGAGALPALVCGAAALALLVHAAGALTRATAHTAP